MVVDFFLQYWMEIISIVLSVVGVLVHIFVFHRLKCTKDLSACLREDLSKIYREVCAPVLPNLIGDLPDDDLASITVGTYKCLVQRLDSLESVLSKILEV